MTPSAKQIRLTAWNLFSRETSQYWNYLLVNLLTGMLVGMALIFALLLVILPLGALAATCSRSGGQPSFALFLTLSLIAAAILVPLAIYLFGFQKWVVSLTPLEVLRAPLKIEMIWSGHRHAWRMGWIWLVMTTYLQLWFLLLIIPGIIKAFSYAMTSFVAVDHPDWTANQCITESCRLMKGNRWRFFCLNLSFIGWYFLAIAAAFLPLVGGFAFCFLVPYIGTSQAVFYSILKEERPLMPPNYPHMMAGYGA